MKPLSIRSLYVGAALAGAAASTLSAQDFVNGDLETGLDVPLSNSTVPDSWDPFCNWDFGTGDPGTVTPSWFREVGGNAMVLLDADNLAPTQGDVPGGAQAGIAQEVTGLEIGQTYTLSFLAAYVQEFGSGGTSIESGAGSVNLYIDGVLISDYAPTGVDFLAGGDDFALVGDMTAFTYEFTATDTFHTFGFRAQEDESVAPRYLASLVLDDFSIALVPEPGTLILVMGSVLGLAFRRRRVV